MAYYVGSIRCESTDIKHYGRLGMKWGRHIFGTDQNLSSSAAIARSVKEGFNEGSRVASQYSTRTRVKPSTESKLKNMSDDDLRKLINRLNMEQQYVQLSGEKTREGAAIAKEVLQTVGSVAGITSSALTIALLSKKLSAGV